METSLPFALYDAFSTGPFGGATAGIVSDAVDLPDDTMQRIAIEVGAPATAFVRGADSDLIDVRFFSMLTEYGMCGHGTVALATQLVETGQLRWNEHGEINTHLRTRDGDAPLNIREVDGRPLVMLDLNPSTFETIEVDRQELARVLGVSPEDLTSHLPIEMAVGDFIHLVVPVASLGDIRRITPDFGAIAEFSRAIGVQTVTVFTLEVERRESTLHCRDFCPAVGTPESPAAGTTNGALTSYLVRHRLLDLNQAGPTVVRSEQGFECGRPSEVRSEVTVTDNQIQRLVVGGFARKSVSGEIFLP